MTEINRSRPLTIGDLSRQSGVNIETIRYYERTGIMSRPERSPGGRRLYRPDAGRRLRFIRRGRELGMSLGQIQQLLTLVDRQEATCAEVGRMTSEHLDDVRRKIADLRRIETVLAEMLAACSGGIVPECPVIDALADGAPDHPAASGTI